MNPASHRGVVALIVITLALLVVNVVTAHASRSNPTPYENARLVHSTFARYYGVDVASEMVRCMYRESHGDEKAANWRDSNGGSFGLLQINGIHRWKRESMAAFRARMWNPVENVAQAVRLYRDARDIYGNGFQPWGGGC